MISEFSEIFAILRFRIFKILQHFIFDPKKKEIFKLGRAALILDVAIKYQDVEIFKSGRAALK